MPGQAPVNTEPLLGGQQRLPPEGVSAPVWVLRDAAIPPLAALFLVEVRVAWGSLRTAGGGE